MATLCVNVDHVATLRQARGGSEPEPVMAAIQAELAGSTGVTVHLREDRRHIQDRDVRLIRGVVRGHLNLEMAATDAMVDFALSVRPEIVTLVPERREEVTTEGGLDVVVGGGALKNRIARLREAGIIVSLFIGTSPDQIKAGMESGAEEIELHTGPYSHAKSENALRHELRLLREGAELAQGLGLAVNAGHGLNYHNVEPVAAIQGMRELNIGHAIISRAVYTGLKEAVAEMNRLIREASRG